MRTECIEGAGCGEQGSAGQAAPYKSPEVLSKHLLRPGAHPLLVWGVAWASGLKHVPSVICIGAGHIDETAQGRLVEDEEGGPKGQDQCSVGTVHGRALLTSPAEQSQSKLPGRGGGHALAALAERLWGVRELVVSDLSAGTTGIRELMDSDPEPSDPASVTS